VLLSFMPVPLRMLGLPLSAFIGGTSTTLLVYRLASANGRTSVGTMLLAGIAVNSLALAFTGFLITLADDAQLRNITFWNLGGLSGNGWNEVLIVGMALVPLAVLLPGLHGRLNALLLGEREARHLGVHVQRLTALCVGLSALAVGAAVSVSGNIQFVGLVVPNLMRLWLGPDHRLLVPGSACCGAGLMIAADLIARTATAPAELPVGIVTAAIGAPFFLWLLVRHRQAVFA
jgi:iron complex transport system permease protein